MNASRITSVSAAIFDGVGTNDPLLRTRRLVQCRNKSVEREVAVLLKRREFSISSRPTTSASSALIAVTIFSSWRLRAASEYAPRCSHLFGSQNRARLLVAVFTLPLRLMVAEAVEHIEHCDVDVAL